MGIILRQLQRSIFIFILYGQTSEQRTPTGPVEIVRYSQVSTFRRFGQNCLSFLCSIKIQTFSGKEGEEIPSIAYWKLLSPSFWIADRCTLSRKNNAFLTWAGSILLFVNVQKISFSSK